MLVVVRVFHVRVVSIFVQHCRKPAAKHAHRTPLVQIPDSRVMPGTSQLPMEPTVPYVRKDIRKLRRGIQHAHNVPSGPSPLPVNSHALHVLLENTVHRWLLTNAYHVHHTVFARLLRLPNV